LTLDDFLRDEIGSKIGLNHQSLTVKMSVAITMIMFIGGLINSILSFITFREKNLRKVGCGMYLLASSITSFLTISMFTIKFWFVILTHMNVSYVSSSVLRGGCVTIEPILKLFLYLDAWLNACVASERTANVIKGTKFDKKKSKRIARWIILILPFGIMATIIHEPLYRELLETKAKDNQTERYFWCITRYSSSVQLYNTIILCFHLIAPFTINLFSALFIVFGLARQRSVSQTRQTYREHICEQFSEHKQLVISPVILLVLSLPRLIISLLSGCTEASANLWLYLFTYFISFTPSMLVFVVFVLPSALYRKQFTQTLNSWRQ